MAKFELRYLFLTLIMMMIMMILFYNILAKWTQLYHISIINLPHQIALYMGRGCYLWTLHLLHQIFNKHCHLQRFHFLLQKAKHENPDQYFQIMPHVYDSDHIAFVDILAHVIVNALIGFISICTITPSMFVRIFKYLILSIMTHMHTQVNF